MATISDGNKKADDGDAYEHEPIKEFWRLMLRHFKQSCDYPQSNESENDASNNDNHGNRSISRRAISNAS